MVIEQVVDVPDTRRLIIDVPREIPAGRTILTFTPASAPAEKAADRPAGEARDIEIINRNADRLNREMVDVLSYQESDF